jgi:predicted RNA-binding protein with PUA-like domain
MSYWLMKTEPGTFSIDDLARAPRSTTSWDGVRNFQARNMLRDQMKRGDLAFMYYSSTDVPGIAGVMEITKEGYPDATAVDRKDWYTVDVKLKERFPRIITLAELRAHANKALKGMVLLRPGNRLSVSPVEPAHWKFIRSLL